MSRSYRKPYSSVTGHSNSDDKRDARRSLRRLQNESIRDFEGEWEDFVLPARYEAANNDVWCWSRDGKQKPYIFPSQHYLTLMGLENEAEGTTLQWSYRYWTSGRPQRYFDRLFRK